MRMGKQSFIEAVCDPQNHSMVEASIKRRSKGDPWVAFCRAHRELQALEMTLGPPDDENPENMRNWQLVPVAATKTHNVAGAATPPPIWTK